jgi:dUTP pyrophosphatase
MLTVKINFLSLDAQHPVRATSQAAGWDCYSTTDGEVWPGQTKLVPLGFAIELPEGWCARIKQRSSMFKLGLITNDSPVDSDYRGQLFALVNNTSRETWRYSKGDRICQLLFERVPDVSWVTVPELGETERGAGGWGSTGK